MSAEKVLVLLIVLSTVAITDGSVQEIHQKTFKLPLQNMQIYKGKLYIGGRNNIYDVDKDLICNIFAKTCNYSGNPDSNCENDNQVLMANEVTGKLIICGTGNSGLCELWNIDKRSNETVRRYMNVSRDINKPAVGMVLSDGNLMIAVTYDSVSTPEKESNCKFSTDMMCLSYDYPISTRDKILQIGKFLKLEIRKRISTLDEYTIYYKSSFQNNGYSYFLTNQKEYVGGSKYVSKLIRICQNDTEFRSYTDIVLTCSENGINYNLLQTAIIVDPPENSQGKQSDKIFIASFTNGNNPKTPTGDSVICKAQLSNLDKDIYTAKNDSAWCRNLNLDIERMYLQNRSGVCIKNITDLDVVALDCHPPNQWPYSYIIGNIPTNLTSAFHLPAQEGYISVLHGFKLSTGYVSISAGTSTGKVFRMYVNGGDSLVKYDNFTVDEDSAIKAIYQTNRTFGNVENTSQDDDLIYILSSSKIFKYQDSNCSNYKTCSETMEAHDPSCGWCVFEYRATRKKQCPDSDKQLWLSSLKQCVSIDPEFKAVSIANRTITKVEIKARNLPLKYLSGTYTYKCQFLNINSITQMELTNNEGGFLCPLPNVTVHTEASLVMFVNTGDEEIEIAERKFLFYNCSNFKSCGDCLKDSEINCVWCEKNAVCGTQGSCTKDERTKYELCPKLKNNTANLFIHSGVPTTLNVTVQNIAIANPQITYLINGNSGNCTSGTQDLINCSITLNIPADVDKVTYPIKIFSRNADLVDDYNNTVTVYNCGKLGTDCYYCKALATYFKCCWKNDENGGVCSSVTSGGNNSDSCPGPFVTMINPTDGHNQGGTSLTIYGKNLGFKNSSRTVMLGQGQCIISETIFSKREDLIMEVVDKIVCKTKLSPNGDSDTVLVKVTVNGNISNTNISFIYKIPKITNLTPRSGPLAGGTRITFTGDNLGIGNRMISNVGEVFPCADLEVFPKTVIGSSKTSWIEGVSPSSKSARLDITFNIALDGRGLNSASFLYTTNPTITSISPNKAFLSGGTIISLQGQNMTNAHRSEITVSYKRENKTQLCTIVSSTLTTCKVPEASEKLKEKLNKTLKANLESDIARRKRDTNSASQEVTIFVNLDGVKDSFTVLYFRDPEIDPFAEEVLVYGTDKQDLVIKGRYLNLVATKYDVRVTIGLEECSVVELTEFNIRCLAPKSQPASGEKSHLPEVNVTIGNIKVRVGYLEYEKKLETAYIIGGAVAGGLLFIIVMVVVIGIYKYRKVGEKARDYQKNLSDMEMEIRRVAREEFLDMHTTMSSVNRNLVEQGFPYHSYQQYACNVMFSVDYLWTEPVVSNGKMTDDERIKANKGMELMESLIYNKFFIVSVISTMEKQKRFFIREKANLAGNLCAVLMGKMDYLEEILKMLLSNLVQETPSKKQKSLFRRCESITEKLLSNWLSLCLYPHIRANSGSPLYLLYIATQKTMESGPIDAILGDAKYTLFEEKLLKKWSSAEEGTQDLKFEAKTLTLNVVVDNGDTIFKCKVLDCDTISQVKSKCMAQIYVNYPASQLNVDPQDLDLEWHEGFGGALRLKDEDNTSKHDGPWVRLNTLAHYNVKDESNMALVDPHGAENREEDYVNLTNVNVDNACNASVDSTEPLHPRDMQNPGALQHWHLVRKEEETSKQGKSAIAELYLNRLFTTKQCLMEYISTLFNIVLEKDRCPPPTKCLFDFLDDLGDRHKIDADTLYTWKSHSYAIRVWASLIKMPSLLFDVNIPNYVEENLDVISQVFIESFSLSSQKFTKDSPSQKLIFHNEMNLYRDKVKEFYKNVKVDSQAQDEYRQYMTEVNKQQQQTNFNKVSALYRLYKQLKPYFEEILEDLTTCKETSNLRLNKKLEEVMEIMEDEEK